MSPAPLSLWGGESQPPCLLAAFHDQAVARGPQRAVVDGGRSITYSELLSWVRGIAEGLTAAGIGPGDRVAVTGRRSAAVVAAMLGTMWVGATYLPLDSEYPAARLAHMLKDSGAGLLLYPDAYQEPEFEVPVPSLPISGLPTGGTVDPVACRPELWTYVIYTSGSTGLPKGVAVPHSCLDTMVDWQRNHSVWPYVRTAQFAPLNFDVSFQEVLGTLCGGGTLVVVPEELRQDPFELLEWLGENRIERLFLPYVALQMLAVAAAEEESLDHLALAEVNAAGEQLVCTPDIRALFARLPRCRLNNHYGQSESAMVTAHTLTGPSDSWPALPPIGAPLPGCELLIDPLDAAEPNVGELLVAGAPLSPGYLNQPELNAKRFVTVEPTPHGHTAAFRTGDLVRLEDGVVTFLARRDKDVKIRGYRVNLLEIEVRLLELPTVSAAVCVALDDGQGSRSLHCAVTVDTGAESLDGARAAEELRRNLPDPYIPRSFTTVAALPRTHSGKVDREAVARTLALR
ncbi:AMP-binding protein [Kitasatospora sp. NPDC017646]|uniref:AMP-binding protein n=1 Tax=Kitasatospora sp. NPDC017646 TaxID=3364024 RepID=UPI003787CF18